MLRKHNGKIYKEYILVGYFSIKNGDDFLAISFCDEFGIEKSELKKIGALDIILDFDTKYFIDPALLRNNHIPEFLDVSQKVERYFEGIVTLIRISNCNDDMYWKKADSLLRFKELKGTCLGYSNSGTSGNAIGKELRQRIIRTIKELLQTGAVEPIVLELLGVFQEKVGCDRISDLVTFIIHDEIVSYTKRVLKELNCNRIDATGMVINPYNGEQILLLPMEILSPLPVANEYDDIDFSCAENERVRNEINAYFDLDGRKKLKKEEINALMINNISFRNQLVNSYKKICPEMYNFDGDPVGQILWYSASKQAVIDYPLELHEPTNEEELEKLVIKICKHFKQLVEKNGLWKLLYDDKNKPKHENAAQLLLFGIADAYCTANGIDISREVNNGQGPVDFKFSEGAQNKILVEVKLTSNQQLIHGISKQLPIYMEQENTRKAIYLIIENGHFKRYESFQNYYNKLDTSTKEKIPYIYVDGTARESASKA